MVAERGAVVAAEAVALVVAFVGAREVVAASLLPHDEQRASRAILVAHHGVRAELAIVEAVEDAGRRAELLEALVVARRTRLVELTLIGVRAVRHVWLPVELEAQVLRGGEVEPRAQADGRLIEVGEGVVRRVAAGLSHPRVELT